MDNINERRQAEAGTSPQKSQECFDSGQPQPMATVLPSGEGNESGQIGRDRATVAGFFAGKRSLDEAIIYQLLEVAKKGLKNAEACIDWYQVEKQEFEKQVDDLEQLIRMAQEANESENSVKAEEE